MAVVAAMAYRHSVRSPMLRQPAGRAVDRDELYRPKRMDAECVLLRAAACRRARCGPSPILAVENSADIAFCSFPGAGSSDCGRTIAIE
jgi:hypothetical protein